MCLMEARPSVQAIFALRFLCGAVLSGRPMRAGEILHCALSLAAWSATVIAIYLLNGATDVREDRANGSQRPIARGDLSPAIAARLAYGLGLAALCLALLLNGVFATLLIAMLLLGYAYSGPPLHLRRHPVGAILVATLGGLLTYAAGYFYAGAGPDGPRLATIPPALPIVVVAMSLWMGLVGGITKDFSDYPGDLLAGRTPAVVRYGQTVTRVGVAACALVLTTAFLVAAVHWARILVIPASAAVAGGACVAVLALSPVATGSRARLRLPYRAFMVTQYVVHLLVLVAALLDAQPAGLAGAEAG